MESIINKVYALAEHYVHVDLINQDLNGPAAKEFDTGVIETEQKGCIALPPDIQQELEHVFNWMGNPREKFFRNFGELVEYLDAARERLEGWWLP